MKTRIFNPNKTIQQIVFLLCCLTVILILTYCTSKEKKFDSKLKTELKDTLNPQPITETSVDTTSGVFLIYKFGDNYLDVGNKTDYLVKKSVISRVEKNEYNGSRNYLEYKIYIDPKYWGGNVGRYEGDNFITEDSYIALEVSFKYFEQKLYQISLYSGSDMLNGGKEAITEQNAIMLEKITSDKTDALLNVYNKKYKGWTKIINEFGLYDYFYKKGVTQIQFKRYFGAITIIYTDLATKRKINEKENERFKNEIEEKNKGI